MSKVIVYSSYLSEHTHINTMLNYIATRDGVIQNEPNLEVPLFLQLDKNTAKYMATEKQKILIDNLIKNKKLIELAEYDDYLSNSNMYTASTFIAASTRLEYETSMSNMYYLKYISERPGVVKDSFKNHGLFDHNGAADLSKYEEELNAHKGKVWIDVISLRREDAMNQSMQSKESWERLLQKHMVNKAKILNIPIHDFKWCAAFHDEGSHPHVHVMMWDDKDKNGYLDKEGIRAWRSELTNDIYKDELWLENELKNERRKSVENSVKESMNKALQKAMKKPDKYLVNTLSESLVNLSKSLPDSGSKSYEYQPDNIKKEVNEIVKMVLSSPSTEHLMREYLESIARIGGYYRNNGEKMINLINEEWEKLIAPKKKDRKVLQNIVLKSAYEFKHDDFERRLIIDPIVQGLNTKLLYPERYTISDAKTFISIAKLGYIQNKTTDSILNELNNLNDDHEKNIEYMLEAKDNPKIYEADLKRINKCLNENIEDCERFNNVYQSYNQNILFTSTHMLQSILMYLGNERTSNEREARRLRMVHQEDRWMIRKTQLKEHRK